MRKRTSAGGGNLDLLLDTQCLVWIAAGDQRLSVRARDAITALDTRIFVSAVTAWEYADLHHRGRLPAEASFEAVRDALEAELLDYPAEAWRIAKDLPDLHRDPIDRMLIAHAIHADLMLVTDDKLMRDYPVRTLW